MTNRYFLLAGFLLFLSCTRDTRFENPGVYGVAPEEMSVTRIGDILTDGQTFEGKEVMVEGITGSVCENRGCWMYVEDGSSRIRVTFKDYGFFVPKDAQGKRVRVRGSVNSRLVSKETLQHWAEEEPGGDPSAVLGDSTMVMLTATGVVIENGGELSEDQKEMMSGHE